MVTQKLKQTFQTSVDERMRDALWALRSRGDTAVLSVVTRHMLGVRYPAGAGQEHLAAAMAWLGAAQDATDDAGVSAFYDVRAGTWAPSYPETTGYIIPTFYDYARHSSDASYRQRAGRMADWLLTLQLEDGAFPIGPLWPDWQRVPIIFDTGQIIQGLVRAYDETGQANYLAAAQRAGDWLAEVQDDDGCWRRFTSLGHIHTYNVRAAWALLQLHRASQQEQHRRAAVANLEWALTQQDADGWFRQAAFSPGEDPLTHTIAYTIEGLLEFGPAAGRPTPDRRRPARGGRAAPTPSRRRLFASQVWSGLALKPGLELPDRQRTDGDHLAAPVPANRGWRVPASCRPV